MINYRSTSVLIVGISYLVANTINIAINPKSNTLWNHQWCIPSDRYDDFMFGNGVDESLDTIRDRPKEAIYSLIFAMITRIPLKIK